MSKYISGVFHFNPTCEYAAGNGTVSWQPNLLLQKMEMDMEMLPIYFTQPSDFLITSNSPSSHFKDHLNNLEIKVPEFLHKKSLPDFSKSSFQIEKLCPWGWSPAEHKFLNPLKSYCSESFQRSPVFHWKDEYRYLYSRKFALDILKNLFSVIDINYIIGSEETARICYSQKEIEELIEKWNRIMIKAPWSSSGRGLQPITKVPVHPKVWEKIMGVIRNQGCVLVEPFLNKAFDMAFQFEIKNGIISYLGISNFITDKKGQYQGDYLNGLPKDINAEVLKFILKVPGLIVGPLIKTLENSALAKNYEGYFGVDTLIYRDENQCLKINPCLEINVRQNMGLLSLQLEKLIYSNKSGLYRIFYNPQKSFFEFVNEMKLKFPLSFLNGKIKNGFFPLTDFNEKTLFGAYLLVE